MQEEPQGQMLTLLLLLLQLGSKICRRRRRFLFSFFGFDLSFLPAEAAEGAAGAAVGAAAAGPGALGGSFVWGHGHPAPFLHPFDEKKKAQLKKKLREVKKILTNQTLQPLEKLSIPQK